jgi:CHAT domain-containing protein
LKLKNAQLAYLSACHAAANRVEDLLDEGIHLAGACQIAGFPHVIGTLWSIHDKHSVQVAEVVYGSIFPRSGKKVVDFAQTAAGLHSAIRQLREENPKDPLVWAPYIHLGA